MSLKDVFLRKIVQSKMKGIPAEEQEKILSIIQNNPELFQKIAMEIQNATAAGKDQMTAAKEIMEKYKDELSKFAK